MEKQLLKRLALSALVVTSAVQAGETDKTQANNEKKGFFNRISTTAYNTGAQGLAILNENKTNPYVIVPAVGVGAATLAVKKGYLPNPADHLPSLPEVKLSNPVSAISQQAVQLIMDQKAELETAAQKLMFKKVELAAQLGSHRGQLFALLKYKNEQPTWVNLAISWATTDPRIAELNRMIKRAEAELNQVQATSDSLNTKLTELNAHLTELRNAAKSSSFFANAQNMVGNAWNAASTSFSSIKNSVTTNGSAAAQAVVDYVKANPRKSIAAAAALTLGTGAYLGYKYLYSSKAIKSIDFAEAAKIGKTLKEEQKQRLPNFIKALNEKYEEARDEFAAVYLGNKKADTLKSPFNSMRAADYASEDEVEVKQLMQGYINIFDEAFEIQKIVMLVVYLL